MMPGLLAEIERVVKVLTSRMPRPTQSTSYRTERKNRKAGQKLNIFTQQMIRKVTDSVT